MTIKLNLLPPGASVAPGLGKVLKMVRTLGIVALGLFLFFVLGISGYLVYSSIRINNLTAEGDSLRSKIKAQETTEQRMVLLKDRLAKIIKVKSNKSVQKDLDAAGKLVSTLQGSTILSELNLDAKKTDLTIIFASSVDLNTFLTNIRTNNSFKRATLTAFSFNPQSGYSVGLRLFAE